MQLNKMTPVAENRVFVSNKSSQNKILRALVLEQCQLRISINWV